jgi:hypothetical protein
MMGAFLGGVANGRWIPWVGAEVVRPPCREHCPTTRHIRYLASKQSSGIVRHGHRETEIMAGISGYDEAC